MSTLNYIILSIVQGITEFLPISSSGHLAIIQYLMKFGENPVFFDVLLHLGTLLSIFIFLRKEIFELIKGFFTFKKPYLIIVLKIIIAEIPALLVGYFLNDKIKSLFVSPKYIGIAFFGTALILLLTILLKKEKKDINTFTYWDALIIGLFQSMALVPGFSRTGFTLFGALLIGMTKKDSLKFSFFLAIPAIIGAFVFESFSKADIYKIPLNLSILTFLIAFLTGLGAIYLLYKTLKNSKLYIFGIYCLLLGIIVLIFV
jgi:undecaprenyl-diphosphatase